MNKTGMSQLGSGFSPLKKNSALSQNGEKTQLLPQFSG